ncbi:MAG: serine hydrolase [Runella sp.]
MKTIRLLLVLLIATNAFAQKRKNTSPPDRFAGLDTAFNRLLKDWKAAGFAVAVVEKNKVIYAKGFGYRDVEQKLPVTPNTAFAIGSCTKAFTSALVGLLQKDGKIEYDKPVTTYLPELRFFNDNLNAHLTVRDMMCHRTGLPRHDFSWYLNPTTRDSLLKRIQFMEPSAPLRERWQYNNFMFLAQGVLTEKLTEKSWEDNVREKILSPLGMKNSFFSVKEFAKQPEPAKPYNVLKDSVIHAIEYYDIDGMGPAGSINSTVLDMAKWVQLWLNGGKLDGKEILPAAYCTEAVSSQMVIGAALPTAEIPDVHLSNYGFGWFLSSYRGHYRVDHGGNINGFSANTSFFPSDSIGIVVLANQNGSAIPTIVRNLIADRLLKLPYHNWHGDRFAAAQKAKNAAKEAEKKATESRKLGTKPSHSLDSYAGLYQNDGYGRFDIFVRNDSLFLKNKYSTAWLSHYHYDIFRDYDTKEGIDTTQKSQLRFQFNTNLVGDIESLSVHNLEPTLGKPLMFTRTIPPKALTTDELKKYVADFTLMGLTIKTYLKDDKTLYVLVPGQPEYELTPIGKHQFNFAKVPGFSVVFDLNDKNEVTALTFRQPNGNFKADRK